MLNNKYYIGSTHNLEARLKEHNAGRTKSTKAFIPYKFIGSRGFSSKHEARKFEIRLKKSFQTRREFIESLENQ